MCVCVSMGIYIFFILEAGHLSFCLAGERLAVHCEDAVPIDGALSYDGQDLDVSPVGHDAGRFRHCTFKSAVCCISTQQCRRQECIPSVWSWKAVSTSGSPSMTTPCATGHRLPSITVICSPVLIETDPSLSLPLVSLSLSFAAASLASSESPPSISSC